MSYLLDWKRTIAIIAGIFLLISGIVLSFVMRFKYSAEWPAEVSLKQELVVLELGEELNPDAAAYLNIEGTDIDLGQTVLNASGVETEVGVYKAYIHLGSKKMSFGVEVVDTTPPLLLLKTDEIFISTGEEIYASDYVESWDDYSEPVNLQFMDQGTGRVDTLAFEGAGTYDVFLCGEDAYGNISYYPFKIHVTG